MDIQSGVYWLKTRFLENAYVYNKCAAKYVSACFSVYTYEYYVNEALLVVLMLFNLFH